MKKITKLPKSLHKIAVFREAKGLHVEYSRTYYFLLPFFIILYFLLIFGIYSSILKMNYKIGVFLFVSVIFIIILSLILLKKDFVLPDPYSSEEKYRLSKEILHKIVCFEEGIAILGRNILLRHSWTFIKWKDIKEISLSKNANFEVSFIGKDNNFSISDFNSLKAEYIYPKEIYQGESLVDGVDHDALNLLWICMRRAYNAKWTGNIKPSDIFGKEWKQEKVVKEE